MYYALTLIPKPLLLITRVLFKQQCTHAGLWAFKPWSKNIRRRSWLGSFLGEREDKTCIEQVYNYAADLLSSEKKGKKGGRKRTRKNGQCRCQSDE